MWLVAIFDLISFLVVLAALIILVRGWRVTFPPNAKFLFLVLTVFLMFYNASLFLQWSGITDAFDPSEDVIGAMIPMVWAFFFYAFLQDTISFDLRKSQEALQEARDKLEEKVKARTAEITEAYQKLENAYQKIKNDQDKIIRLERRAVASRITSTLAHETRNPLSVIGGFARFLKRSHGDDPDLAPYTDSILEEAEKLERLIMGILKAGREAAFDFEKLDPQQLLEDLYLLLQEKARLSGVKIRKEAQPSSASIMADRESLITALKEIVLNALEASPKDAEVVIKIDQEQEWLVFSVSDRGQGIDDQSLPKIYEPFYSTKKLSSGMGLSYAKELIEVQNGYIRFDTKPGHGTTVYVYLPQAA